MPARFFRSDNRPEQVFYRTGHGHHFMSLELRKVDDFIGLVVGSGEANGAKRTSTLQFNAFNEFHQLCTAFTGGLLNTAFLCDPQKTADTRTVADQCYATRLSDE